ncbi:MAG: hypothetical protein ACOX1W_01355 [Catenisphaera adipataccumulans]|uniref:hypothetical protein n=1 Tax=Catenisphaera adipataccumulans TaxID=700500 RepID=UPI003D8BDC43
MEPSERRAGPGLCTGNVMLYTDGDTQRVKNQQQVLRAIIKKITSASMIKNYAKFADALSGAFETKHVFFGISHH